MFTQIHVVYAQVHIILIFDNKTQKHQVLSQVFFVHSKKVQTYQNIYNYMAVPSQWSCCYNNQVTLLQWFLCLLYFLYCCTKGLHHDSKRWVYHYGNSLPWAFSDEAIKHIYIFLLKEMVIHHIVATTEGRRVHLKLQKIGILSIVGVFLAHN